MHKPSLACECSVLVISDCVLSLHIEHICEENKFIIPPNIKIIRTGSAAATAEVRNAVAEVSK